MKNHTIDFTQKNQITLPIPKRNGDTWVKYGLGQSSSCPHFNHKGSLECNILGRKKTKRTTSYKWRKHGFGKEFEP